MFVPRSARRIRLARTIFVVAALLPCLALVAWAVHRRSAGHRDEIRGGWERAIGLPIAVAAVEHPLPGVVRARGCGIAAADGRPVLAAEDVRVETSPTEVRVAVAALDCDPAAAALLAGLAGDWLWRGARFRRDVIIDIADCAWSVPGVEGPAERRPLGPIRIECVAKDDDRAVRIARRDGPGDHDEVRVVRSCNADGGGERLDVEASCGEPLPFPILAAVVGHGPVAALPFGGAATLRGQLTAAFAAGGWSGTATGQVDGIDLAACTAALAAAASGTMDVRVDGIEWRDGRLVAAEFACETSAGRVDRRLLDALVSTLGCRAGVAGAAAESDRPFDAAAWNVRVDRRGIEITGSPRLGGAVAVAAGRPLLGAPGGIVPPERMAWLLAPSGAVYVPSSGPGSWLMSIMPRGGDASGRPPRTAREAGDGGF